MTDEPRFLSVDEVAEIHAIGLRRYGGAAGLRNPGLLDSAVAQASTTFGGVFVHPDLCVMAATYAFHIAQNQPFRDGNKRAGLGAALTFLADNGRWIAEPTPRLHDAMIAIAERRLDKAGLADLLRELTGI